MTTVDLSKLPKLTKRGLVVLTVASTALTMIGFTHFFAKSEPVAAPAPPQIIVIVLPCQAPPAQAPAQAPDMWTPL